MMQYYLTGLTAGIAAAFLYVSMTSGSALAFFLFYIAPLPLFLAGFGWGAASVLAGAVSGSVIIFAIAGFKMAVVFLISTALPAVWLSHLSHLSRQSGESAGDISWYPVGRLVIWTAVLGGATTMAGVMILGLGPEDFREMFTKLITEITASSGQENNLKLPEQEMQALTGFLANAVIPVSAMIFMLGMLGNMWLAARILKSSGKLRRPWPDLAAIDFPGQFRIAMLVALAAGFIPGLAGQGAVAFIAAFFFAYALLGLAIIHQITRPLASRPLWLAGLYFSFALLGWPLLLVAAAGMGEPILKLRQRANNSQS